MPSRRRCRWARRRAWKRARRSATPTGDRWSGSPCPPASCPDVGGLQVDLASTALVGLGEGARYLADYPYGCAEQKASSALALSLAADLGDAFSMGRIAPADYRARATTLLNSLPSYQCDDGGFGYWPGRCLFGSFYLTSYVLHVMHVTERLGIAPDKAVVTRALDFLEEQARTSPPAQVQWLPAWSASVAFATKVLAEHGRQQDSNITRLYAMADRLPIFALSYLADAMAESGTRGTAVRRGRPPAHECAARGRRPGARRGDRLGRAPVALELEHSRDSARARWLRASRGRFAVRAGARALAAPGARERPLAEYSGERDRPRSAGQLLQEVRGDTAEHDGTNHARLAQSGERDFRTRTSAARPVTLAMPDVLRQVAAGTEADLAIERSGTGRLFYAARLQYVPSDRAASDRSGHARRAAVREVRGERRESRRPRRSRPAI